MRTTLADLDRKIANLVAAFEDGGDPKYLTGQLDRRTAEREALKARMAAAEPNLPTSDQIAAIVQGLGGIAEALQSAPVRGAGRPLRIFGHPVVRLTYDDRTNQSEPPQTWPVSWGVSEGGLLVATSGDLQLATDTVTDTSGEVPHLKASRRCRTSSFILTRDVNDFRRPGSLRRGPGFSAGDRSDLIDSIGPPSRLTVGIERPPPYVPGPATSSGHTGLLAKGERKTKRGSTKRYVYTYPSKKSLTSVTGRLRALTRRGTNPSLGILLYRLNPVLRGWTNYFRHVVSKATFNYLRAFIWQRVVRWVRRKHPKGNTEMAPWALPPEVVADG